MTSSLTHAGGGRALVITAVMLALAATAPLLAHAHTAIWLDGTAIDDGVYISVSHPRIIRNPAPFRVSVVLADLAAKGDVRVREIRWTFDDRPPLITRPALRALPDRRDAYQAYQAVEREIADAAREHDAAHMERLTARRLGLLEQLADGAVVNRCMVEEDLIPEEPGSVFRAAVEIDLVQNDRPRTIRRAFEIPIHAPLPLGRTSGPRVGYDLATSSFMWGDGSSPAGPDPADETWFAGDQHLHTKYSLDALVLHGTEEDVTDYAAAAELVGLDWIIVTDHSNVHVTWEGTEYYTPEQFAEGTAQAAAYTAGHDFLALYGEEMGLGSYGLWNLPSHMLAYPHMADSTGFLENPSSGLIFGHANCEPEQVIIDRINNAGGLGFIAHPFDSGALAFVPWHFDNGAVGWAGMEIFSDTNGIMKDTDEQSFAKWHELLTDIAPPENGQLLQRPDFPSAFPVGLGNSDAHEPELIGMTFTYARVEEVTREQVTNACLAGRCVASNGPLVFGRIAGAGAGDVAVLQPTDDEFLLTLQTTPEFGPVGDYRLTVFVNGSERAIIPPSGAPDYEITIVLDDLALSEGDRFITIRADSADGVYHAMANPIWLQFTCTGDFNGDEVVDTADLLHLLGAWGTPDGDVDGDDDTDTADLLALLAAWGDCP
jgi:hypothetical protein